MKIVSAFVEEIIVQDQFHLHLILIMLPFGASITYQTVNLAGCPPHPLLALYYWGKDSEMGDLDGLSLLKEDLLDVFGGPAPHLIEHLVSSLLVRSDFTRAARDRATIYRCSCRLWYGGEVEIVLYLVLGEHSRVGDGLVEDQHFTERHE